MLVSTERVTLALLVGEWLRMAIQPLQWCHIYAPVAPQHLALELIQCPAPYLLGIARETLHAAGAVPPKDVVVVDLDNGTVRAPAELKAVLPAVGDLVKCLIGALQPHSCSYDTVRPALTEAAESDCDAVPSFAAVGICQEFLQKLLAPVQKCFAVLEASEELVVALDEERFVKKATAALCADNSSEVVRSSTNLFLRQLIRSQSFSENLLTYVCDVRDENE